MSTDALAGLWPYLVVVLVGFLPTELWRSLAVVVSRGLGSMRLGRPFRHGDAPA